VARSCQHLLPGQRLANEPVSPVPRQHGPTLRLLHKAVEFDRPGMTSPRSRPHARAVLRMSWSAAGDPASSDPSSRCMSAPKASRSLIAFHPGPPRPPPPGWPAATTPPMESPATHPYHSCCRDLSYRAPRSSGQEIGGSPSRTRGVALGMPRRWHGWRTRPRLAPGSGGTSSHDGRGPSRAT